MSLKHLSNFWRSIEMSLANWKAELKFNWTNHYVLSANTNSNKIILIIKDTKVFFSLATLSANDHQNLSKPFNKGLRRSVYRNKYNTKSENKDTIMSLNIFSNQADCLYWFIQIKIMMLKCIKLKGIIYQKVLLRIITSSPTGRTSITNQFILIWKDTNK